MKKLLLASTALVATAGVAAAQEITLSGQAEMGIYNADALGFDSANGEIDSTDGDTQFFTDIDVTFTMSGEADNGLTFGANIDLDESDDGDAFSAGSQGGEAIFVSFGGATFTMGDTDGALDARVPEMALAGGSLADDETVHAGFDDGAALDGLEDGQIARFDYTYSAFTFSLSAEQDDNGDGEDPVLGVGVSYATTLGGANVNIGLGHQRQEDANLLSAFGGLVGNDSDEFDLTVVADQQDFLDAVFGPGNAVASDLDSDIRATSLAATAGFNNGLSLGATYTKTTYSWDGAEDETHVGVGVGYEMNALAVGLNYGKYNNVLGFDDTTAEGYGLAASYDLGGGLSLRGGYAHSSVDTDVLGEEEFDTFSLGAQMNF